MIKRDTLYSDIKVNNFPAHKAVLVEASETFKNMMADLSENICELNLDFPDALVDRLLDLIYYNKYEMDIDLFNIIVYMNITGFRLTTYTINYVSVDELKHIVRLHSDMYSVNYIQPQVADYKFLCCLDHEQFMNILNPVMERFMTKIEQFNIQIQVLSTVLVLRCFIMEYEKHHLQYSIF